MFMLINRLGAGRGGVQGGGRGVARVRYRQVESPAVDTVFPGTGRGGGLQLPC